MFAKKPTTRPKSTRRVTAQPLKLRTETLHALQDSDLSRVIGGTRRSTCIK
jgi:hypothetical protein